MIPYLVHYEKWTQNKASQTRGPEWDSKSRTQAWVLWTPGLSSLTISPALGDILICFLLAEKMEVSSVTNTKTFNRNFILQGSSTNRKSTTKDLMVNVISVLKPIFRWRWYLHSVALLSVASLVEPQDPSFLHGLVACWWGWWGSKRGDEHPVGHCQTLWYMDTASQLHIHLLVGTNFDIREIKMWTHECKVGLRCRSFYAVFEPYSLFLKFPISH